MHIFITVIVAQAQTSYFSKRFLAQKHQAETFLVQISAFCVKPAATISPVFRLPFFSEL